MKTKHLYLVGLILLLAFWPTLSPGAYCAQPPSGLVGWWSGDGNASDLASTNDGVLGKGVTFEPGKVDLAFAFDGKSTRIDIPDSNRLKLTNSLTIEAWINVRSFPSGKPWGMVLFRGDNRPGLDPYWLATTPGGTLCFGINGSLTAGTTLQTPIASGRFVHIAATLDDTTGRMRIYLDGTLANETTTEVRPLGDLEPSWGGGIGIGNHCTPTSDHNYSFDGLIDELGVFDRALSSNEIAAICAAGAAGMCITDPFITSPPRNTSSNPGSSATLSVVARGSLPLGYQWRFNGADLPAATNANLVLTNIAPSQTGIYMVVVSNFVGSVSSAPARLTILTRSGNIAGPFAQTTGEWITLPNGGFESGNQYWDDQSSDLGVFRASVDFAASSAHSAKAIPSYSQPGPCGFALGQNIAVEGGRDYVLSGFFHTAGLTTGNLYLDLNDVSFEPILYAVNGVPEWQFAWSTFTTPEDFTSVRVRLVRDGQVEAGEYGYVDEVAVTPVEEFTPPASRIVASPVRSGMIVAGDALRFSAVAGRWSEGSSNEFLWFLGDGRSSRLQDPGLVIFSTPGATSVQLEVRNSQTELSPTLDARTITVIPDTNALPDFAVAQLDLPAALAASQPAQIAYVVRNIGDAAVSGQSWKDALYLSRDQYLDVNDRLLISASVSPNVPVNGAYTNTISVTIPTVDEGAWYLLLSIDDEWQILERHQLNNEFAVATDLVIPRLTNAVAFASCFSGNGDEKYFRIDVPAGQNLLVRLNGVDNLGASELYIRLGALPVRGAFDFRVATPGAANQELLIPAAAPGTYYIMVHGESVPGSGQFTLQATTASLDVTSITPSRLGQSASAVLTITGAGFDAGAVAELVASGGAAFGATSTSAGSFTQLTATSTSPPCPWAPIPCASPRHCGARIRCPTPSRWSAAWRKPSSKPA